MKSAQGLPINFIVLAAMAVLVLILVSMFFIGGFRTDTATTQVSVNKCDSLCLIEQRKVTTMRSTAYDLTNNPYCDMRMDIRGVGDDKSCNDITSCTLTFTDGARKVTC